MTIIAAVQTYIKTYSGLQIPTGDTAALVSVDYLGDTPIPQYAIVPQPGTITLETYIDGSEQNAYPFALQFSSQTEAEVVRLANSGWFEAFRDWLRSQTDDGVLPTLPAGKTAESIEATNHGFLFEQGGSGTAAYQVSCQLIYSQIAP